MTMKSEKPVDPVLKGAMKEFEPSFSFTDSVMNEIIALEAAKAESLLRLHQRSRFAFTLIGLLFLLSLMLFFNVDVAYPYELINDLFESNAFAVFNSPLYVFGIGAVLLLLLVDRMFSGASRFRF